MSASQNSSRDIRSYMYQNWVFSREGLVRQHVKRDLMNDVDVVTQAQMKQNEVKQMFWAMASVIFVTIIVITLLGYLGWMATWYYFEGRVDPLTLLIQYSYQITWERINTLKFTLSPLYWYREVSKILNEAGAMVMKDMETFHFK